MFLNIFRCIIQGVFKISGLQVWVIANKFCRQFKKNRLLIRLFYRLNKYFYHALFQDRNFFFCIYLSRFRPFIHIECLQKFYRWPIQSMQPDYVLQTVIECVNACFCVLHNRSIIGLNVCVTNDRTSASYNPSYSPYNISIRTILGNWR